MNEKELILEAMKKAGEPLNAGKVAELTGLDRKIVDKAFAELVPGSNPGNSSKNRSISSEIERFSCTCFSQSNNFV